MARTRRSASPPTRPTAAATPARTLAPQQKTHQSSAQPQQPQVTNVYIQRGGMGGGMGSGLLGNVASVAAGSVIGHGISHMLFDRNAPPAQPAEAQEVARQVGNGMCSGHIQTYAKCLEANESNPTVCKWAWETFAQCQAEQQPTQ
uniref:CHCH domain-containing protein n=1 Tax=Trypanosoma congolense (strain IL3000) TaxID=1068625 RepID=G0UU11_TRYCI|nr:conserved hypothetical protein [Trypanosoma congolense IL3000]